MRRTKAASKPRATRAKRTRKGPTAQPLVKDGQGVRTSVSSRPIANGHIVTTEKTNMKTYESTSVERYSRTKPKITVK